MSIIATRPETCDRSPRRLAKHNAAVGPGLRDDAGLGEGRRDVGRATEHAASSDDFFDLTDAVDAVLKRQDDRVMAGDRVEQRQRFRIAVGLDRVDHEVDRSDAIATLFELALDAELTLRAFNRETARAHGVEMRTACDEDDVVPGTRHLGAVVSAHGARTDDADSHGVRQLYNGGRRCL